MDLVPPITTVEALLRRYAGERLEVLAAGATRTPSPASSEEGYQR
jgi:hypothetical protein